jgi:hypothetical protein
MSSWRLCRIEHGRYRNIPAEASLCPHCDLNKVETEIHFLLECPKYQNLRNDFYNECSENIKNYWQLYKENKFIWIMSNETPLIVQRLATYISKCFQHRGSQSQYTVNLFISYFWCVNCALYIIFFQCYILHTCQTLILFLNKYHIIMSLLWRRNVTWTSCGCHRSQRRDSFVLKTPDVRRSFLYSSMQREISGQG